MGGEKEERLGIDNTWIRLDESEIKKHICTSLFGQKIYYYEEVDSTNTIAKRLGKIPGNHGALIIANSQKAGKGRLGREWISPKNKGIWMSLILTPRIDIRNASMLTLIAALGVNEGIRRITGLDSFIKWPNDIVVHGKKICGILTEMSTIQGKIECVVIGIGINVANTNFSNELEKKATSLEVELGCLIEKWELVNAILESMEKYYSIYIRTQSLIELKQEYNKQLINYKELVQVLDGEKGFKGVALGINEFGELLVETEKLMDGKVEKVIQKVVSGEVSVRGVYGYV